MGIQDPSETPTSVGPMGIITNLQTTLGLRVEDKNVINQHAQSFPLVSRTWKWGQSVGSFPSCLIVSKGIEDQKVVKV